MFWKVFKAVWLLSTFASCAIFVWDDGHMILPIMNGAGFVMAIAANMEEE